MEPLTMAPPVIPSDDLPDFNIIFRATYPDSGKLGPKGRRKTKGKVLYECLHCSDSDGIWSNGKRDNAIAHAKRKHADLISATDDTTIFERDSKISRQSLPQRDLMESYFSSRPSDSSLRRVFNRQQYIESITSLLTRRRLPFSTVSWDEMQDIMLAGNPAIRDLLLTSRTAAMRHIAVNFDLYASQLRAQLQTAVSKVHFSTDLWKSPHRHEILAVCARWVDNNYQPRKALLAMPECRYSHRGERQAALIAQTIKKYDIAKQIGYYTGDNATSNDTCLKHLSEILQREYGVGCHAAELMVR